MSFSISWQKVHAFLDWWFSGLCLLIPEELRSKIFQLPDILSVEVDDGALMFKYARGEANNIIQQKRINPDETLGKADTIQWLSEIVKPDAHIILLINEKQVLKKSLSLPLAGDADLREILGFEMDRQTPFTVEQVYFDFVVTDRDYRNKQMQVQLYTLPITTVDPVLGKIRDLGMRPHGIHPVNAKQVNKDINLLPAKDRARRSSAIDFSTRILIAGACLLFIAVLYLPILRYQGVLESLGNEVTRSRMEAQKLSPLMKERDMLLARRDFLMNKQGERTQFIEVLLELTSTLPDDTSLDRLIVTDDKVQLEGESDAATAILPLIEQSTLFRNAQFRSPVTRDNAANKDRFQVSAELTREAST